MFKFLGVCFFAIALTACWFNSDIQSPGAKYLQGEWQQDSIDYSTDLVEFKNNQFKFTCDSFYLVLNNFSKADFSQDTCYHNGKWKEYVKGVYTLSGDTISLKGAFVSASFRFKKSPCYTTGGFEETLLYQSYKDSVLVLKSTKNGKLVFKLKKRLACEIKK